MPHADAGWHQRRFARLATELHAESPDISKFLTNLQSKRLKMVAHAYPATVRAASEAYGQARLAEMFWADQPPRHMHPSTAYIQNIDMWGAFIQQHEFAVGLPWLPDLARFERFRCKLILRAEEEPEQTEEAGPGERYHMSPLCDTSSFQYDVIAIAAHFLQAGSLESLPPDLCVVTDVHLVIQCPPPPADPAPRTYQVGANVMRLIQKFATGKTIADVLDGNPAGLRPGDRDQVVQAISQLAARGIICPLPVSS